MVAPQQDLFYQPPASLSTLAPGTIVADRPVTLADPPAATAAWQISFRSNDSHDEPILAVTTLMVPTTPWPGPGLRPAVSLQFAEDSTALQCAPSYTLRAATSAADGLQSSQAALPAALLQRGWAVAVPDHEGPRSAFTAGPSSGHVVLDGIRAAARFTAGGLTPDTPWGLTGYSGGGTASGWAAQMQPSYAPELHITGAAIGGTPSDLMLLNRVNDNGPASPMVLETLAGIDAEYPEARISELLNAHGRDVFSQIRRMCTQQALTTYAFTSLRNLSAVPGLLDDPHVAGVLADNTLGHLTPRIPIYDYHGVLDELVPVGQDDSFVHQWCSDGATVQIVRDPLFEHIVEGTAHQDDAVNYLADRFTSVPAPDQC
ncbi:lipase family protein [Nocardia sp. alder85J]|uniref:lipase family protein n=1 Tax=Nocardia sp. alder85J TaxID=2862949 RepID=UPI001CD54852|nr:lipase family protein [Nocardia sp. alder85J]MCX4098412.1 lipase family protein [Nocardia sp. alder85J]